MSASSYSRSRRREAWEEWLEIVEPAQVRQLNGVTQAVVGKALGVDHRTISQWESGRYFPQEPRASAYRRIIAGLARHLEIPEGEDEDAGHEHGGGKPVCETIAALDDIMKEQEA